MKRYYYSASISDFLESSKDTIIGELSTNNQFNSDRTQIGAWSRQIEILKNILTAFNGRLFFEFSIPRMGQRIDVVLIIHNVIFVLEFKNGSKDFHSCDFDQVYDYALDLKNFHETSHKHLIAPILVATDARNSFMTLSATHHSDNVLVPLKTNASSLRDAINLVLDFADGDAIDPDRWLKGRYSPTPTIIEAAMALYNSHSVADISKHDATNLGYTSFAISTVIDEAKSNNEKSICFVTGVPGAGKTLVGLDIATKRLDSQSSTASVFLSGNGPLVAILREALTRDKVKREKAAGRKVRKGDIFSKVKLFIQNVHHFRDECLTDQEKPPFDHVTIFDEAQRAWNHDQTAKFMARKKDHPDFAYSEPEFLISCMDRHSDWAVIICLVGGGQEINTGEAGIAEWIESLNRSFPHWKIYMSARLNDSEYAAGKAIELIAGQRNVHYKDELHLSVSMRSFRAEHLSSLVKCLLDLEKEKAQYLYREIMDRYPIAITRDFSKAKRWLKEKARGSERYGIIVSSQAQRLKPHAIDVRSPMNPVQWFLNEKDDVRSSFYLEDVATEFHVQGLELDWACVTWDADLRYMHNGWGTHSFVGNKWQNIKKDDAKQYLKNAYRVLLTRARQGMVIVVPEGDKEDPTRKSVFYDGTFLYLQQIGFSEI